MKIYKEFDFDDLMNDCWSGAIDTLKTTEENDKEKSLMSYLSDIFSDEIPNITEINDYLWFERDSIYEFLGITEDEEKNEE